jgi:hypothetical protein
MLIRIRFLIKEEKLKKVLNELTALIKNSKVFLKNKSIYSINKSFP